MVSEKLFSAQGTAPSLPYVFTAPSDWDPSRESLPLIVFLHGAGERGTDLSLLKNFPGITKVFCDDPDYHGLRVLTISPQCPADCVWSGLIFAVRELIETVCTECNVDRDRITITGVSMGGFGTWEMICSFPELFAASAPVCGGGMSWRAKVLQKMPLRVFHGGVDSVVELAYSQMMTDAVNKAGGNATLTVFPGVDHNSWIQAYGETDVIDWLATQKKA